MNKKVLIISSSPRKGGNSENVGGSVCQGRTGGGPSGRNCVSARKAGWLLQGLSRLPESWALRHPRRCRGNCRQNARCGCAGVRNTRLLLLRQRSAQDYAGSCQPIVRYGLRLYESLLAGNSGRGRTGNLCGHREGRAGLGRLLPPLCAGGHSVCRRRKRRGRDHRSYCAGASLSDGQGCLNKHFRYEEHILSQQE